MNKFSMNAALEAIVEQNMITAFDALDDFVEDSETYSMTDMPQLFSQLVEDLTGELMCLNPIHMMLTLRSL